MTRVCVTRGARVDCRAVVRLPISAGKTWGQIRDFRRFASQELFHAQLQVDGGVPRAGAAIRMTHRFFLFRVIRVGRICRWREGAGFAFSDLSPRGALRGFPHVFSYQIDPLSPDACDLHLRVAGKWTARAVTRWLAWLWLKWIMAVIVRRVENELMAYQLWLRARSRR